MPGKTAQVSQDDKPTTSRASGELELAAAEPGHDALRRFCAAARLYAAEAIDAVLQDHLRGRGSDPADEDRAAADGEEGSA